MSNEEVSDPVTAAADVWCAHDFGSTDLDRSVREYRASISKKVVFIIVCVATSAVVAGLSLGVGQVEIGFSDCYRYVWNHITGDVDEADRLYDFIVVQDRAPRIVTSLVAGAGLAVSGCVMQSILKNPLADPYTTGVSSGAGFGATLAFTAGFTVLGGSYTIIANAFVFALVPTAIIIAVSRLKGSSPTTMIMAGIAVMFLFNAISTVLKLMAEPDDLAALYAWQVGSVGMAEWNDIALMFAVVLVGTIVIQFFSRKLNILSTGDDNAKAMGLNVENLRIILLLLVSFVVATVVSFTGLIGFVGLVSPHICRLFIGADNRFLIPASAMFGATLLVVSDLVGRTIIAPAVLQVGVVTAFIGGPMFLYLIIKQKKQVWRWT